MVNPHNGEKELDAWNKLSPAEKNKLQGLRINEEEFTKIVAGEFQDLGNKEIREALRKKPVRTVRVYSLQAILPQNSQGPQIELIERPEKYGEISLYITDQYNLGLVPYTAARPRLDFLENDFRIRERINGENNVLATYHHELWEYLFLRGLTSGEVPAFNIGDKVQVSSLEIETRIYNGSSDIIKDVEIFPRADYVKGVKRYEADFDQFVRKMIASKRRKS